VVLVCKRGNEALPKKGSFSEKRESLTNNGKKTNQGIHFINKVVFKYG